MVHAVSWGEKRRQQQPTVASTAAALAQPPDIPTHVHDECGALHMRHEYLVGVDIRPCGPSLPLWMQHPHSRYKRAVQYQASEVRGGGGEVDAGATAHALTIEHNVAGLLAVCGAQPVVHSLCMCHVVEGSMCCALLVVYGIAPTMQHATWMSWSVALTLGDEPELSPYPV